MAKKRYIQAINEALFEEMERDPKVILFGEDVELAIMGDCRGLTERFGRNRIRNTPICEQTLTGMAVGAAAAGHRVILHLMFSNFIYTGMDAIGNQMAKMRLMSGGQAKLPITVIASYGGGGSNAAQHSDTAYPPLLNLGGINVLTPATPGDAKGLLKSAIRDDNPVIFFEDKMMYRLKGPVPSEEYTIPLGLADIKREGTDITLVATSSMVQVALGAAKMLEESGVSAEVIDPRTMWPLDEKTLIESAKKTSHVIVIDEGYYRYGVTAEIASVIAEGAFYNLDGPVKRIGAMHVPIPFSPPLEDATIPSEQQVFEAARELCGK
jgi:pyruvate dehydrogenase E1 component beta subunit